MRIVSLLPSATEIICALGAEAQLVGVSHEGDFPPSVRNLPVLPSARIDSSRSRRDIDAAVRVVIRDALSIYAEDDARLRAHTPDQFVTQDLCEACAVSLDDVRAAVAKLAHRERVDIVSLSPRRLADVLGDLDRVAIALGQAERGAAVRAALELRIRRVADRASATSTRPRVATLE